MNPPTALPASPPADPLPLVACWLDEAREAALQPNPNAMTLASVDKAGQPSARVVLLKHFDQDQGFVVFYTHYNSRKGAELAHNPRAAAVLHWDHLGRQLRCEGQVVRSPAAESDAYFRGRPWLSQLNAWASDQSKPIPTHAALIAQARQRAAELGVNVVGEQLTTPPDEPAIERPAGWGGYRLWINALEFWVHGDGRFHDRIRYQRTLGSVARQPPAGPWSAMRLQP